MKIPKEVLKNLAIGLGMAASAVTGYTVRGVGLKREEDSLKREREELAKREQKLEEKKKIFYDSAEKRRKELEDSAEKRRKELEKMRNEMFDYFASQSSQNSEAKKQAD